MHGHDDKMSRNAVMKWWPRIYRLCWHLGGSFAVQLLILVNTPRNAHSELQCRWSRRIRSQCLRIFLPARLAVCSARSAFPCNNIGCITLIPCVRHLKSVVPLVLVFRHRKFSQCTTGIPPTPVHVKYLFRIWQAYLPIILLLCAIKMQHISRAVWLSNLK